MFKKIYRLLKPKRVFIFANLVTYRNKKEAALNQAKNSPVEDQIEWLKDTGFKIDKRFLKFNTALLICKK